MADDDVELCWPKIVQALGRIPHFWDRYTEEFVREAIRSNHMQVWALGTTERCDLLILTAIYQYPKMKVLRLMGASGDHIDTYMQKLENVFDGYASIQGCQELEIIGRPGWTRKFAKLADIEYEYRVFSKPVGFTTKH